MSEQADESFCAVAQLWMESKYASVKPYTAEKYRANLEKHLLPAFGNRKVSDISCDLVTDFLEDMMKGKGPGRKPVSENTAHAMLVQLHNILRFASEECGLNVQEISGASLKKRHTQPRILSREEERLLRERLAEGENLRNLGILLCLDAGLRVGELSALKWEDISLRDHTVYIHRSVIRVPVHTGDTRTKLQLTTPKGEQSVRRVPVPEADALRLEPFRGPDENFFLTGDAEKFADNRTLQYHLKKIMTTCGIENAGFNTLRDTFAVRYLEGGGSLLQLSRILGHINVAFTAGHYLPACEEQPS